MTPRHLEPPKFALSRRPLVPGRDYVDRGKNGLECICLLLAYKIKYPENFFLLRGNHECASINRIYGFYDECKRRYSIKLWKTFTDCFNCLPVAAVVDEKILCMHGGLSPDLQQPPPVPQEDHAAASCSPPARHMPPTPGDPQGLVLLAPLLLRPRGPRPPATPPRESAAAAARASLASRP